MLLLYIFYGLNILVSYASKRPNTIKFAHTPNNWEGKLNQIVLLECSVTFQGDVPVIAWLFRAAGSEAFDSLQETRLEGTGRQRLMREHYIDIVSEQKGQLMSSKVKINRVRMSDQGEYKCLVNRGNTYGGIEHPAVKLTIIPEVFIHPSVSNIEIGMPIQLFCNTSFDVDDRVHRYYNKPITNVKLSYSWSFNANAKVDPYDNEAMEKAHRQASGDFLTKDLSLIIKQQGQILYIPKSKRRHAGYYWCNVLIEYPKRGTQIVNKFAIIKWGPNVRANVTRRSIKAFINEEVTIDCNIEAQPYARFEWFKGRQIIASNHSSRFPGRFGRFNGRWYTLLTNERGDATRLLLNRVIYEDRGEYSCNVTSFDGTRQSWTILLKVKDKYSSFYPFAVIMVQIILIFTLIFGAEKIYVQRGDHHHSHHHSHCHGDDLTLSHRTLSAIPSVTPMTLMQMRNELNYSNESLNRRNGKTGMI